MSIVFTGPGPCLRGWGRLTGHWCHWSLLTSPLQCLAPGPRLLSPRAPAPGHHDTHHVTCDNVMSVTCDMTQVRAGNELTLESCMWPQRAGAGRDSEPPERRTGLQSTGTSGERHWESVSHFVSSLVITNNEAVSWMLRMAIWPRQWNFKYIPTPSGQLIFWAMLVIR